MLVGLVVIVGMLALVARLGSAGSAGVAATPSNVPATELAAAALGFLMLARATSACD